MKKLQKLITSDRELTFCCKLLAEPSLSEPLPEYSSKEVELYNEVKRVKNKLGGAVDFYDSLLTKADKALYGKFFSPKWLGQLVARLGVDKSTTSVFDLCCGSGCLVMEVLLYSYTLNGISNTSNIKKIWGNDLDAGSLEIFKSAFRKYKNQATIYATNKDVFKPIGIKSQWDLAVLNPPFSLKWEQVPEECYQGILAPRSKGDWAILQKALHYANKVVAVTASGVWTRMGAEAKIREHIISNNWLEALIFMPSNLFVDTGINTCIAVFNKNKKDTNIVVINAEENYSKGTHTKHTLNESEASSIALAFKQRQTYNDKLIVQNYTVEELIKAKNFEIQKPRPPIPKDEEPTIQKMIKQQEMIRECREKTDRLKDQLDAEMDQIIEEWKKLLNE